MPPRIAALLVIALTAFAAARVAMPFDAARPLLALAPPELKSADAQQFATWTRNQDKAIRARLEQGDLDSMVNLLLFGTSFTTQPRMTIENLAAETRAGLLRARLADLQAALAKTDASPRLQFVRDLLRARRLDPASQPAGAYILDNLQRVLKERIEINQKIEAQDSANNAFSTRGVSLDTTIFPNYAIDAALGEAQSKGLLQSVARAAILGPGLDFIDKDSGFDYYPLQTLQPFALSDSLASRKLGNPKITILDISSRVRFHILGAIRNAKPYVIQLPRNKTPWLPAALEYWKHFGDALALPAPALDPPANVTGVETRAVRFPTATVLALDAEDVNIVTQRLTLPDAQRYDLMVATNILVYYTPFEQALALANIAAMLKPGGLLLTNDELPAHAAIPMRLAGRTEVEYTAQPRRGDTVFMYRKE
ncbi:MAG: hypothetical protein RL328_377 [Acidobacteriota bacterium]